MPIQGGPGGASPAYVKEALEASLRRLGTDYVDLYQLHRPDPAVPIADTLGALGELVVAGKVREVGVSNYTAEQIRSAFEVAPSARRPVSVQNEYSVLHRDPEVDVLPSCASPGRRRPPRSARTSRARRGR
jgi:aryl-alcohol dehydrogenase-like predicted oxidoreductase